MDRLWENCRAFHPKDPAHGTLNYDIGALRKDQKSNLNLRKCIERCKNEVYLKAHPEIEGLILILLRFVLHEESSVNVHETIGEFFNRPREQILAELVEYFLHSKQGTSFENYNRLLRNVEKNKMEKKVSGCNE